jgi:hypothetical protein
VLKNSKNRPKNHWVLADSFMKICQFFEVFEGFFDFELFFPKEPELAIL